MIILSYTFIPDKTYILSVNITEEHTEAKYGRKEYIEYRV